MLQGALGQCLVARLAGARTHAAHAAALAGAGLLVLFPALRIRMFGHTALAGTWLILAALCLWAFADRLCPTLPRACLWWALMGLLGAGLHLYYLPMMGIVAVGCGVAALVRRRGPAYALVPIAAFCAAALAELFLLGAFAGNFSGTSGGFLEGADLANLFVPGFDDGLETNVYLGAGAVLACALAAAAGVTVLVRRPDRKELLRRRAPWLLSAAVIGLLSALAAQSSTITLAGHTLFSVPLPGGLMAFWSMFSSCARLIWVLSLLLLAVSAAVLLRAWGPPIALGALILCVAVQTAGQWPALSATAAAYRSEARYTYTSGLTDDGWQAIADSGKIRHLAFASLDNESGTFWDCAVLAAEHHWALNCFYLAHMNIATATVSIPGQMYQLQPATLYVFSDPGDELRRDLYDLHYYRLDGILLGSLEELPLPPPRRMTTRWRWICTGCPSRTIPPAATTPTAESLWPAAKGCPAPAGCWSPVGISAPSAGPDWTTAMCAVAISWTKIPIRPWTSCFWKAAPKGSPSSLICTRWRPAGNLRSPPWTIGPLPCPRSPWPKSAEEWAE